MSTTSSSLNSSWKSALNSRPQGSFIFPENVVVEELLAHIDETWTTLWEGRPISQEVKTTQEDSEQDLRQSSEKKSWWQAVRKVFCKAKKPKQIEASFSNNSDTWISVMPRFPSWVDWSNEYGHRNVD